MSKFTHNLKRLKYLLLSKYGFIAIFLLFAVWVIFFDENSKIEQSHLYKTNAGLKKNIENDKKIIAEKQFQIKSLSSDINFIEKYARENYLMKAPNEEVFLFKE